MAVLVPLLSRYRQCLDTVQGGIGTTAEPIQTVPRHCPGRYWYHCWADMESA